MAWLGLFLFLLLIAPVRAGVRLIWDEKGPRGAAGLMVWGLREQVDFSLERNAAGNLRLGTSREPECKTIAFTEEIRFYYDEPKKSWILPEAPQWFGNLPQITEMHTENGVSTVTADYVPEQPAWSHSAPEPAAQAVFTVTEFDGIRQITSLHFAGEAEADSAAETRTE